MKLCKARNAVALAGLFLAAEAFLPRCGMAYVDPGTTGVLAQILYVLFYGALGLCFFLLKFIKQYLVSAKQFLARLFGRESYR